MLVVQNQFKVQQPQELRRRGLKWAKVEKDIKLCTEGGLCKQFFSSITEVEIYHPLKERCNKEGEEWQLLRKLDWTCRPPLFPRMELMMLVVSNVRPTIVTIFTFSILSQNQW